MSNADIKLCFRVIDLEDVYYKSFKDDGKYNLAEQVLQSKRGMERMLAALLGQPVEKLEEADFKKWATEMYRAWLAGGKEALAAAIEKRDKTEAKMSNADIKLCFRVIDLEDVYYKGFKDDGKYYLAEQVLQSKRGMERMLAVLLGQPVEKLAEIRKLN